MIKVNGCIIEQKTFPDNTPLIKQPSIAGTYNIVWKYESMSELFNIFCLVQQLKIGHPEAKFYLDMPYTPNARQDRTRVFDTDVFTLKWFAEILNHLGFEIITVADAHSSVTPALINNCIVTTIEDNIELVKSKVVDPIDIYFYPDNGAEKKYADYLNFPYAYGAKKRDWATGKIQGLKIIGDVENKNILIIDDICSKGGTIYHSAKKLKELGANKIYVYITHCENAVFDGNLLDSGLIEKIYTTDSILTKQHDLIEII